MENYFLINGQKCDQFGRTRLDEECITSEECPIYENHFFKDNHCEYCPNCTLINCAIKIRNLDDLKNISDCNIVDNFEILDLEDSKEESIMKLLIQKLQNVVEIHGCLIINNSPGVKDLNFLKKLRKITSTNSSKCQIDGVKYSIIIKDNENLQSGFVKDVPIIISDNVLIKNNRNLCQNIIKNIEHAVKFINNQSIFESQTIECNHPVINNQVLTSNHSALLLLDIAKLEKYKVQLIYWKRNKMITEE